MKRQETRGSVCVGKSESERKRKKHSRERKETHREGERREEEKKNCKIANTEKSVKRTKKLTGRL